MAVVTTQQPEGRKEWAPEAKRIDEAWPAEWRFMCRHCGLMLNQHLMKRFCPEWRLRQLDGDR